VCLHGDIGGISTNNPGECILKPHKNAANCDRGNHERHKRKGSRLSEQKAPRILKSKSSLACAWSARNMRIAQTTKETWGRLHRRLNPRTLNVKNTFAQLMSCYSTIRRPSILLQVFHITAIASNKCQNAIHMRHRSGMAFDPETSQRNHLAADHVMSHQTIALAGCNSTWMRRQSTNPQAATRTVASRPPERQKLALQLCCMEARWRTNSA
jgi:hypothetical protein